MARAAPAVRHAMEYFVKMGKAFEAEQSVSHMYMNQDRARNFSNDAVRSRESTTARRSISLL